MSDTAPILVTNRAPTFDELAGAYALSLSPRPRPALTVIADGLRRFADSTPGRANLKLVEKEQPDGDRNHN